MTITVQQKSGELVAVLDDAKICPNINEWVVVPSAIGDTPYFIDAVYVHPIAEKVILVVRP